MAVSVVRVDSESPWIELGALKLISDSRNEGRVYPSLFPENRGTLTKPCLFIGKRNKTSVKTWLRPLTLPPVDSRSTWWKSTKCFPGEETTGGNRSSVSLRWLNYSQKTNISPEKCRLEDNSPIEMVPFQLTNINFPGCKFPWNTTSVCKGKPKRYHSTWNHVTWPTWSNNKLLVAGRLGE